MIQIPPSINKQPLSGLNRISQGKVRECYNLPAHPNLMLVVVTDRISIFDVVLPTLVEGKGEILNAINIWWRMENFGDYDHDLVAFGSAIDSYLPDNLKGNKNLYRRATVVKKLSMIKAELIARGYLAGSAYKAYLASSPNHEVCGIHLFDGLKNWSTLSEPIFTPSTKAEEGHDEHMSAQQFKNAHSQKPIDMMMSIYGRGRSIALEKDLVLIDTKCEVGYDKESLILGDECLTPDSSRYVRVSELDKAQTDPQGKISPKSLDKQAVRDWGLQALNFGPNTKLTEEVIARIHAATIPSEVVSETSERYHELFQILTGMCVSKYRQSWETTLQAA